MNEGSGKRFQWLIKVVTKREAEEVRWEGICWAIEVTSKRKERQGGKEGRLSTGLLKQH